jgi:competence protein CoiA
MIERHSQALLENAAIAVMPWSPNADSTACGIGLTGNPKTVILGGSRRRNGIGRGRTNFPSWQEIGHTAQSGERHRADVKTESGLVLEFQYSALSEAERVSREEFYTRLVWVVHANKRLRDRRKFFASLSDPLHVASKLPTFTIHRDDGALLRDWGKSRAPVYFDFGETGQVWRFYPFSGDVLAYVMPVVRAEFVKAHCEGVNLEEMFDQVFARDREIASAQAIRGLPLPGFSRYSTRRMRRL